MQAMCGEQDAQHQIPRWALAPAPGAEYQGPARDSFAAFYVEVAQYQVLDCWIQLIAVMLAALDKYSPRSHIN